MTGWRVCARQYEMQHPITCRRGAALYESEGHGPQRGALASRITLTDLSMHLMWEIYHKGFRLFSHDFERPRNKIPRRLSIWDEVHLKTWAQNRPIRVTFEVRTPSAALHC